MELDDARSKHVTSLVKMKNIHKSFGRVVALKGVNFEVWPNEIVGVAGDNGAGKSTLIKALMGVFSPTEGEIYIRGKKISLHGYSAKKAHELRIEAVYQEKALGEKQPLWRNIFIGRQISTFLGFIRVDKEKEETNRIMKDLLAFRGRGVSAESVVSKLSGGERQGVAIGRAMYFDADLVILDEPTIALSLREVEKTLNFVRRIKEAGKSCIYITHNISDMYSVSDRFVLMDRGEIVGEYRKDEISLEELNQKLLRITAAQSER